MILAAFVTALSQILLKKSAMKEGGRLISQYLNAYVILGYLLMTAALVMNIWAYRTVEYHLGPLLNASSYIFVLVLGKLILREKITPTRDSLKNIVRLGTNMCVENLVMRVGFLATALLAARLGTDEFAAHNVGMNLLSLTFSFADGMQAAAVALSGQALGAGEKERAKQYGTICQHIGLGISVCLSLLLLIGGRWFFGLYFAETHIIDMGVIICRFMCVIVLLQISQIIFGACLRAAGDIFYTLMASLISVAVIRTVVTWVLVSVFQLGLVGVWLGILSDQMTRFLLMGFRFRQGKWVEIRL